MFITYLLHFLIWNKCYLDLGKDHLRACCFYFDSMVAFDQSDSIVHYVSYDSSLQHNDEHAQ